MSREIQIFVSDEENAVLQNYPGVPRERPATDEKLPQEALVMLCQLKDKSIDLFYRRYQAARDVSDMTARRVGINPENTGYWLYTPDGCEDGSGDQTSEIVRRMEEWISRSGDKAQMKRRIQELEEENRVLRSLFRRDQP